MPDIIKTIASNVRKERIQQGLTQEALAEKADLHPNYIGMIERQQRNVGVLALEGIAKALHVTVIDLLRK